MYAASTSKGPVATDATAMRMPPATLRCWLAKVGRPVRVQWMRADEHVWDPKGAPTLIDLEAGLDAQGGVVAWSGQFYIPEGTGAPVTLLPAHLATLPRTTDLEPGYIFQNSAIPYDFTNRYT